MNHANEPGTAERHLRALVAMRQNGCGLPRAFYHDEVLYHAEIERIWRRHWLFAGHTCQIPQPGDYFTFALGTDSVIVMRDDDGAIRPFHNVCRHRGTLLCQQETGHVGRIVCPYHQWTYSRRGELLSTQGMHSLDAGNLDLHPVHAQTCAGLIFLSFAEAPPDFGPARELFAAFAQPQGFERAKVAKIIDYEVPANWKLLWENNRECYHCNANHPQYVRSNFDIYEDARSSEAVKNRIAARVMHSEAKWVAVGLAVTHKSGGLPFFPDPEHNRWYSANRTVLAEGYESESMDGGGVAPLMGDYRDSDVGVLRLRTLPNFWNHSSCDHGGCLPSLVSAPVDLAWASVRMATACRSALQGMG